MASSETHAVTGAFSYTGKYIAAELQRRGHSVRSLVRRVPCDTRGIDCRPLQFRDYSRLAGDLEGASVLYITYWIRFERQGSTFAQVVQNTATLARAAREAGINRIVHISVSNADTKSPFAYFRGKARTEVAVAAAGLPYSVIRPTLVYGREDVLINNMTWLLRTFRMFPIAGDGSYRLQPVFVGDVAQLAVDQGTEAGSRIVDAAGPEILTFAELIDQLRGTVSGPTVKFRLRPSMALGAGVATSQLVRDPIITSEELRALMAETLVSHEAPRCRTRWSEWLAEHKDELGRRYTSELKRHWRDVSPP